MFSRLAFLFILFTPTFQIRDKYEKVKPDLSKDLLFDPSSPYKKTEFSFVLLSKDTECFFHFVPKYAKMQFQYRVLTPPSAWVNNHISLRMFDPSGETIHRVHFQQTNEMQEIVARETGFYEFCLYNGRQRFADKKVRVMFTYVKEMEYEEVQKEQNDTLELASEMRELTTKLIVRTISIFRKIHFQRMADEADHESMKLTRTFIGRTSTLLCLVIVITAVFQTYAMRRMFRDAKHTPTMKPRA